MWIERDAGANAGVLCGDIEPRTFGEPGADASSAFWTETGGDLQLRAEAALRSLLKREAARYLVVSHRVLLERVLCGIVGADARGDDDARVTFRVANAAFSRFRYWPAENSWLVDVIGERAHLPG